MSLRAQRSNLDSDLKSKAGGSGGGREPESFSFTRRSSHFKLPNIKPFFPGLTGLSQIHSTLFLD